MNQMSKNVKKAKWMNKDSKTEEIISIKKIEHGAFQNRIIESFY